MKIRHSQIGITGLETAISLIALVVVASVFAYTVLSAGIFSSEKSKEAIYAGLSQARGTMELVGSVKATSIAATAIDALEAPGSWVASANVTGTPETADYKQGTSSLDVAIAAAFGTGLIIRSDTLSVDLTSPLHYAVQLWIKASSDTVDGVLQVVLSENSACAAPRELIDIPALATDTWKQVTLDLASTTLDAIVCAGLFANSDPGAINLTIDDLVAPKEVTSLTFVVANALDGEPINLATTADADSDGIISDEATPTHTVTVSYADSEQRLTDAARPRTRWGTGDGDGAHAHGQRQQAAVRPSRGGSNRWVTARQDPLGTPARSSGSMMPGIRTRSP